MHISRITIKKFLKKILNKALYIFKSFLLNKLHSCEIQTYCQIELNTTVKNSILEGQNKIGKYSKIETSRLGMFSYCGEFCRLQNVEIGKFVSIGSNVKTCFGAHPINQVKMHPAFYNPDWKPASLTTKRYFHNDHKYIYNKYVVKIEDDVWIGDDVNIFDGVIISKGAIIGANSQVRSSIPENAIAYGYPAKIVGYRKIEGNQLHS